MSHFVKHARQMRDRGAEVVILTAVTSKDAVSKIHREGFRVIDTGIQRSSINPFGEFFALTKVRRVLIEEKPDYIHNYGTKPIVYGTIASRLLKKKVRVINNLIGMGVVFSEKGIKYFFLKFLLLFLYRLLLNPKGSRVISENEDDAALFVRIGAARASDVSIISGAGVDLRASCPVPWDQRRKKITIIMHCRLLKSKGVLVFSKAAEMMKGDNKIEFILAGDIDLKNRDSLTLKDLLELKRIDNLKYVGFIDNPLELLKRCHICVLPSIYREGIPKSLIEGCATGLAIITGDQVGCREVVRNNNGCLLSNPRDATELVRAVEILVSDIENLKAMCHRSRELAEKKFSEEVILQKTMEVYESFANG